MATLQLNTDEASVLREYVKRAVSDLSHEIADTDRKDYRDVIKNERDLLQSVMQRLDELRGK